MAAPPRTLVDFIPRVRGAGSDVVHWLNSPDETWRLWVEGDAYPRIVIDVPNSTILTGNGAVPPAPFSGSGAPTNARFVTMAAEAGLSAETTIDNVIRRGALATRGAFGNPGVLFFNSDPGGRGYYDTGAAWVLLPDAVSNEINVVDYGALNNYDTTVLAGVGTNPANIAANDAAFTLAWADARAAKGMLVIPAGNYGLSPGKLATTFADAGIRGEDEGTTFLWLNDPAGTGTCISQSITDATYWATTTRTATPSITGLTIDGTNAGTGSVGLRVGPAHSAYWQVRVRNFTGVGGANGVTGMTGAIGILMQNNPGAAATQFTESSTLGSRMSAQNCTNALVMDANGGHISFGYNQFQFFHFRNCTTGISVVNGARCYAGNYNIEGVVTTAIVTAGITLGGSDSRFTGRLNYNFEINNGAATVTLIATNSASIWKTAGYIDGLTSAFAVPTVSIAGVFEHEGPFYVTPLPGGSDGWAAQGPFDGSGLFPVTRTAGASGVASVFTLYGDFRERYKTGAKVRWTEAGAVKYGVVSIDSTFGASVTTVTLFADVTHFMAGNPDVGSLRYSFATPPNFPANLRMVSLGLDPDLLTMALPANVTLSALVAAALDETTIANFLTALGIDVDVATLAVPANMTVSSFVAGAVDETTIAAFLTALGLDPDLATELVPASTTISSFVAGALDETNLAAFLTAFGLDPDLASISIPASVVITAFAATLLDDVDAPAARLTLGIPASWEMVSTLAADATTTSLSLVDTGLTVPVLAAGRYEFEVVLRLKSDTDTAGMRAGLQVSAGTGNLVHAIGPGTTNGDNAAANIPIRTLGVATTTALLNAASIFGTLVLQGILVVGDTNANFTVQYHKITSGTATVEKGSTLKARKVA